MHENPDKSLSYKEALQIIETYDEGLGSFKGKGTVTFIDRRDNNEFTFYVAIVYKKAEFLRLDALSSLGVTCFNLYATPGCLNVFIPFENKTISFNLDNLEIKNDKKWRLLFPLSSLNFSHLIGIPLNAKPIFMKKEVVSKNLFYLFDIGGYGVMTFDRNGETIQKNEQFNSDGLKTAMLQFRNYKRFLKLYYPWSMTISDYNSETFIKLDLENITPFDEKTDLCDYKLLIPEKAKSKPLTKCENNLSRWFIFSE